MEATLIMENSLRQADNDQKEESELPRTVYLYCAKDNDESLFEQFDAAVSVPLITEFRDFVLTRQKKACFLKSWKCCPMGYSLQCPRRSCVVCARIKRRFVLRNAVQGKAKSE